MSAKSSTQATLLTFNNQDGTSEGRLGATEISFGFKTHQLGSSSEIHEGEKQGAQTTYSILKHGVDNLLVHNFVLVHLADLGLHHFTCEPGN